MCSGCGGCGVFRQLLKRSSSPRLERVRWAAGAAVWLLGMACTTFEPGTDELSDPMTIIEQQEPGRGRDWSCLREEEAPALLVNSPVGARPLVLSLQLTLLVGGGVPSGVRVRACATRDVECAVPLTSDVAIDARGWVDLPLYEGFDGFLEIRGDALVPTMLFYGDPLRVGTEVDTTPLGIVEQSLLPGLSQATGTLQDMALGLVYLRAFDCQRTAAPGVTFAIDREDVTRWYFVGSLPSSTAEATGDTGLGGFINVRPGIAVVRAELPGSPVPIASPQSVLVRPGWMTGLRIVPPAQ
jgi:hypothetical protein